MGQTNSRPFNPSYNNNPYNPYSQRRPQSRPSTQPNPQPQRRPLPTPATAYGSNNPSHYYAPRPRPRPKPVGNGFFARSKPKVRVVRPRPAPFAPVTRNANTNPPAYNYGTWPGAAGMPTSPQAQQSRFFPPNPYGQPQKPVKVVRIIPGPAIKPVAQPQPQGQGQMQQGRNVGWGGSTVRMFHRRDVVALGGRRGWGG